MTGILDFEIPVMQILMTSYKICKFDNSIKKNINKAIKMGLEKICLSEKHYHGNKYSRASRIDIELSPDNFWEKSQNLVASI